MEGLRTSDSGVCEGGNLQAATEVEPMHWENLSAAAVIGFGRQDEFAGSLAHGQVLELRR